MNITTKQRNFFLLCGGILALFYVAHSVESYQRQAAFFRQQAIRASQQLAREKALAKAKEEAAKKATAQAAAAASAKGAPVSASAKFPGIWRGRSAMEGLGLCDLRLELRPRDGGQDGFMGYSSFSCVPVASLMAPNDRSKIKPALLSRMSPDAAILTGKLIDGVIRFQAEKNIGADVHGCAVDSFTLTPFGANALAAEWRQAGCPDGKMILTKVRPLPGEKP
jgi:hypothetical protein